MARLSILMIKSSDLTAFEGSLASVLANRPANAEVIVVCPGGYEDPYGLATEVQFLDAAVELSTGELWNWAIHHARGEVVHLLQCGLEAVDGWTNSIWDRFGDDRVAAVAPLLVEESGRISGTGIRLGSTGGVCAVARGKKPSRAGRASILGPSWQAAFYRRETLVEEGGFDPAFGKWMGDVDLALRLKRRGCCATVCSNSQIRGLLKTESGLSGFQEMQLKERLYWKHFRSRARLPLHLSAIALETCCNIISLKAITGLAGRISGMVGACAAQTIEPDALHRSPDADSEPRRAA